MLMNLMASVSKIHMGINDNGGDVLICHVSDLTQIFDKCNGEIECWKFCSWIYE